MSKRFLVLSGVAFVVGLLGCVLSRFYAAITVVPTSEAWRASRVQLWGHASFAMFAVSLLLLACSFLARRRHAA